MFPELGFYTLPGHTRTPTDMLTELREAERLGIGSAWISERFDVKDAAALAGAACAVTDNITIGLGATNINTRHPLSTAAMAATSQRLSGGRFTLGVARGVGIRYDLMGLPKVRNRHLRDFVEMMKKLWRGERVVGYDGPLGNYPYLHMSDWLDEEIPILFVGFGPRSLEFAGGVFDGVILHTFLSDEALARSVQRVRQGAEKAGRKPESVKVWSVLATVCEPTHETWLRYMVARMGTYLQAPDYGELLVAVNDWDPAVLEAFRAAPVVAGMGGGIDSRATLEQLEEIATLIPEHWLPAACGSAEVCARRFQDQFRQGVDGVVIHASQPWEFAPVLEPYRRLRDGG